MAAVVTSHIEPTREDGIEPPTGLPLGSPSATELLAAFRHRPTARRTTRTGAVVTAAALAHAPPTQVVGLAVGRRNGPA